MDRQDRARRRAAFGRLWEADAQAKSLAHGLELEEEAEREDAAFEPHLRGRPRGRFVAISAVALFVLFSVGLLAVLVDQYESQAFLRDHGVAGQAVITDKMYSDRPPRVHMRSYYLDYRFWPQSPPSLTGSRVEGSAIVSGPQFQATSVGQVVPIRYNPQRPSQSMLYFGAPPTDQAMIVRDAVLLGVWVIVFGGLCALSVMLAWPDPIRPRTRFGRPREAKPSR
ncbi:MAG TPA: DUF3592 domain-containing protein [Caulobacteraceae bacterium]|jgi:hypothetical protein|nr:DUF3592 domain-containing protein [Caulobacteraceae bacterium]